MCGTVDCSVGFCNALTFVRLGIIHMHLQLAYSFMEVLECMWLFACLLLKRIHCQEFFRV